MEKERETARMEAKRRKLMEKKVREHGLTRFCFYCFFFFNSVKERSPLLRTVLEKVEVMPGEDQKIIVVFLNYLNGNS